MAELNLSKYGITGTTEIVHNPSYELCIINSMRSWNVPLLRG